MIIKEIYLRNFRNYLNNSFNPINGINIIVGNNGIGKTNILEALTVISNTKSFKTNDEDSLVFHDKNFYQISVKENIRTYSIVYNQGKKHYFINDTEVRNSDFIGHINVVLFEPNELTIFKDSPKKRRKAIDIELSKIYKEYLNSSIVYYNLIKEKNTLLKSNKIDELLIETINEKMAHYIVKIVKYRKEFIDYINLNISPYYQLLTKSNSNIKVSYDSKFLDLSEEEIFKKLQKNFDQDQFLKSCSIGTHKEDFIFYFDENEVKTEASQGQKRMIVMAYKLSLIDYIIRITKETPILLLDDVLSELDLANRQRLLDILNRKDVQTIITTTDVDNLNINSDYRLINLKKEGK